MYSAAVGMPMPTMMQMIAVSSIRPTRLPSPICTSRNVTPKPRPETSMRPMTMPAMAPMMTMSTDNRPVFFAASMRSRTPMRRPWWPKAQLTATMVPAAHRAASSGVRFQ